MYSYSGMSLSSLLLHNFFTLTSHQIITFNVKQVAHTEVHTKSNDCPTPFSSAELFSVVLVLWSANVLLWFSLTVLPTEGFCSWKCSKCAHKTEKKKKPVTRSFFLIQKICLSQQCSLHSLQLWTLAYGVLFVVLLYINMYYLFL